MRPTLALQYLLPHRALSRIVYWATRWTWTPWKNFLIASVVKNYAVDMGDAVQPDPHAYASFNAFFTRALKPGARTAPADPRAVACPADGKISQAGAIVTNDAGSARIFQAKGFDFSVAELLGDEIEAQKYTNGQFATVYLSPRDYHRMHMPLAGTLRETVHIPGRLFSVAPFTVEGVPRLFARNERLVCHFDGEHGPFAVVMVGAMLVSSVETVWGGLEIPPYASTITHTDWREKHIRLERFAEMGRFNMGSTVILLLPPAHAAKLVVAAGESVRVGQPLD
ncbi:archaetidylserine decarboxylase [Rudaea cellulosilytica]|uniref:archaetidylserine decarboxylase n=1 Tax=Rudaea cellulosilytica TaxID=540746 RepID=UPI00036286AA|nr:archaetidylserine decarboxylase [Rudaea cellulosilytica]